MELTINNNLMDELDKSNGEEEMSIGMMIIIGIACGVFFCIVFSCCAESWDHFMTKRITGSTNRMVPLDYMNEDERSSDISDLQDGWESNSDDRSSEEDSIIREHGYRINTLIQDLAVYKANMADAPNILPPMYYDSASLSVTNSSCNERDNNEIIDIGTKMKSHDEECIYTKLEPTEFESWASINERIPLCNNLRKLLRLASDSSEDQSSYSSDCSSLTCFQEEMPSSVCSKEYISQPKIPKTNNYNDCYSDDSTVACGNTSKGKSCKENNELDVTMDLTSLDESLNSSPTKDLKVTKEMNFFSCHSTSNALRCFSIVIPTIQGVKNKGSYSETLSRSSSSNSSLTVSDDDSLYGQLYGKVEI